MDINKPFTIEMLFEAKKKIENPIQYHANIKTIVTIEEKLGYKLPDNFKVNPYIPYNQVIQIDTLKMEKELRNNLLKPTW